METEASFEALQGWLSGSQEFLFSVLWIAFWIAASIVYRFKAGKAIFPKAPEHASFVEKRASGPWAANCLIVAVTDEILMIAPRFPFNLMFLPEIYRGEHYIPIADVGEATVYRGWMGMNVEIPVRAKKTPLKLSLKQPDFFVRALNEARIARS